MSAHRGTTRIGPVAALAAYAVARGIPLERICAATGLTLTDLVQPERRLPDRLVGVMWQLVAEELPDEPVALQLAQMAPLDHLGPITHVITHAETLHDALRALVRYRRILSAELRLELRADPDGMAVHMWHPLDDALPSPAPTSAAGLTCRLVREVMGIEGAFARFDFTHARRGPLAAYTDFFGCPVHFEQPRNRVVLHLDALDRAPMQSDRHRFAHLTAHLDLLHGDLVEADAGPELTRVRAGITHIARRGDYRADALASHLGLSRRSLQRLVKAQGTTVKALLDEARLAHARRLLGDDRLSMDEVAFVLGYSAESAFRRAFKRWTGQSPADARRSA